MTALVLLSRAGPVTFTPVLAKLISGTKFVPSGPIGPRASVASTAGLIAGLVA